MSCNIILCGVQRRDSESVLDRVEGVLAEIDESHRLRDLSVLV